MFVIRSGAGEVVWTHTSAGGVVMFAPIPASVPTGNDTHFGPRVRDVSVLASGDVLLLVVEDGVGLSVRRLTATGVVTSSPIQPASTLAQPGDRCLGPLPSRACVGDHALGGCAPTACSVRPWEPIARAGDRFNVAMFVPDTAGATVEVVYESGTGRNTPPHVFGNNELYRITFPVP